MQSDRSINRCMVRNNTSSFVFPTDLPLTSMKVSASALNTPAFVATQL